MKIRKYNFFSQVSCFMREFLFIFQSEQSNTN
jgi:hypothetical protein